MSSVSHQYNNLKYAIETLCVVIESCKHAKLIDEQYLPQLDRLTKQMSEVQKNLAQERSNTEGQKKKWSYKIKKLLSDARLDESLDESLKEKIVLSLRELVGAVDAYKAS